MCSGWVSSSCSTCGTRRVTLVTKPVIGHKWRKDLIVITTNGTYPWLDSNPISRKSWFEPQALEYRINWVICKYTPYVSFAGMLLHINGKFTMKNLNNLFCCKVSFLTGHHCRFRCVVHCMKQAYLYMQYICILYFKLSGIDTINQITKLSII